MRELRDVRLLMLKAALFVVTSILAGALLWWQAPTISTLLLLAIAIWASARAYYFLFYVIEHYIDPRYHFSGLASAVAFLWKRRGE